MNYTEFKVLISSGFAFGFFLKKICHLPRNISKQEPRNSHSSVKVINLHVKTYLLVKDN